MSFFGFSLLSLSQNSEEKQKKKNNNSTRVCLSTFSTHLFFLTAVTVSQPYRVVSTNGTAQIQCFLQPQPSHNQIQPQHDTVTYPYPEPEDFRVILLKGLHGTQEFCSSIVDLTEQRQTREEKEGEVSTLNRWMLTHANLKPFNNGIKKLLADKNRSG